MCQRALRDPGARLCDHVAVKEAEFAADQMPFLNGGNRLYLAAFQHGVNFLFAAPGGMPPSVTTFKFSVTIRKKSDYVLTR